MSEQAAAVSNESNEEVQRGLMGANSSPFIAQKTDTTEVSTGKTSATYEDNVTKNEQARGEDGRFKQTDYKKRYDDIKRYHDKSIKQWKEEKALLKEELRKQMPKYTPPKTPEELATFRKEYPDIYDVVETVAAMRTDERAKELETQLENLKGKELEASQQKAQLELSQRHPDFNELRQDPKFHDWVEKQEQEIQDWLYSNTTSARKAAMAIDLYKAEVGSSQSTSNKQVEDTNQQQQGSAADAVQATSKPEPSSTGEGKIWTSSEIRGLSIDDYEKHKEEIMQAGYQGRIKPG